MQAQSQSHRRPVASALVRMQPLLVALVAALLALLSSLSAPLPVQLVVAHNVPVSLVQEHGPVASQLMEAALVAYASATSAAHTARRLGPAGRLRRSMSQAECATSSHTVFMCSHVFLPVMTAWSVPTFASSRARPVTSTW